MAYISRYSGEEIDTSINTISDIQNTISSLQNEINVLKNNNANWLNTVYPVGSIYMSVNSTSPASFMGGGWEQIKDKFILSAGDTYAAGAVGGSTTHTHTSAAHTHTTKDHTLTVAQMPSHTHNMTRQQWYSADSVLSAQTGSIYSWKSGAGTGGNTSYSYLGTYDIHAAGNGQAHNHGNTGSTTPGNTGSSSNLPPYLAIYVWKRIS